MSAAAALRPSRALTIEGAVAEVRRCLKKRIRVCLEIYSRGDRIVLYEYPPRAAKRQKVVVFGMTDRPQPKRWRVA